MGKRPRGTGMLFLRGDVWWIQCRRNGKAYRESSHSKIKLDAERLLAKRLGEMATDVFTSLKPNTVKLSRLFQLVIEDYQTRKLRSVKDVEWRVRKHLDPRLGQFTAKQFGTAAINGYIRERRAGNAEDSTINRELAIVRRGFTLAVQSNPPILAYAPFIPKLDEDNARQGFIEHEHTEHFVTRYRAICEPFLLLATTAAAESVDSEKSSGRRLTLKVGRSGYKRNRRRGRRPELSRYMET